MPLSRAEKLQRQREAEPKRRAKLKEDPEESEKLKQKEREKYLEKKEKKQDKPIAELSGRDTCKKRKQWRESARTYRQRKQQNQEENEILDQMTPRSTPVPPETSNVQRHTPHSITGKRVAEKNRKRRSRRSQEKELAIDTLEKQVSKYKAQCRRLKQNLASEKAKNSGQLSPQKRVTRMMLSNQDKEISENLLFAEALKDQLKSNHKELKTHKEKRNFRQVLSGRIVKKYRITNGLQGILRGSRLIGTSQRWALTRQSVNR